MQSIKRAILLRHIYINLANLLILPLIFTTASTHAQVISHELRRLALATNQFGIDALKALDRIEPPDKVIVFCPVCLSSTLMMIMMGSSKYQVVSSLRHALYVWSMRPQDINRGFKDVFGHIGLNQNRQSSNAISQVESRVKGSSENKNFTLNDQLSEESRVSFSRRSFHLPSRQLERLEALSLPSLIRLKEQLGSATDRETSWWHSMARRHDYRGSLQFQRNQSMNHTDRTSVSTTQRNNKTFDQKDASQMSAMSSIYIQRGLTMNYNYNLLLRQYYETVIHPVDFVRNAEETRQHINALVAANTENKIKDLVKKGSLEDKKNAPKILMISTFHFRGTLDLEMKSMNSSVNQITNSRTTSQRRRRSHEPTRTRRQPRQLKAKTPTQFIETEATLLKYGHFSNLDCSVIEIPFNNRLVTLIIVMPNRHNSTDLLLTRLSAQVLSDMISSLVVKKLSLEIPVIKFDRGHVNTEGLLRELGLDNLFFGNQSYSTETGLNRWLRPSDIVHETSIDIGTMNPNWGLPEDRLKVGAHESRANDEGSHLKLDKPFFYFVLDSINNLILTMGRIRQ